MRCPFQSIRAVAVILHIHVCVIRRADDIVDAFFKLGVAGGPELRHCAFRIFHGRIIVLPADRRLAIFLGDLGHPIHEVYIVIMARDMRFIAPDMDIL